MWASVLLVLVLVTDAFMASFAYGSNKIKIPLLSALVITVIGTSFLGISLLEASLLRSVIPAHVCTVISFAVLFLLGLTSLFQSTIKTYLSKKREGKQLKFKLFDVWFVIDVFVDETKADIDHSQVLSSKEAVYLAVALSLDSLAMGIGGGLVVSNYALLLALSFGLHFVSVIAGSLLGRRLVGKIKMNVSWLNGAILILLALFRIF